MVEGNNDQFMEDGEHIQGAERGGHFCYKKDNDKLTVEVDGLVQANLMPGTTSLNSGDFPFTFHTHPVVINLDEIMIDNYPNLISSEDLIGCIVDNFYCNYPDGRSICNKTQTQQVGGINFFDIVAVPYGLFVYRPNPNYYTNKSVKMIENKCDKIFNASIDLLPQYEVASKSRYFNTGTGTARTGIGKYVNLLSGKGFLVDFFPWSDAIYNGIQFVNKLPTHSYVDDICMC